MEKNGAGCQASPEAAAAILCINNCGFFGTSATMNMCSKCHKDMILKQEHHAKSISSLLPSGSEAEEISGKSNEGATATRCSTCRKRVGLTGFSCRCGNLFCCVHRYSDKHDCPFDYLTASRDAIAKGNPVVKGQKLDKI